MGMDDGRLIWLVERECLIAPVKSLKGMPAVIAMAAIQHLPGTRAHWEHDERWRKLAGSLIPNCRLPVLLVRTAQHPDRPGQCAYSDDSRRAPLLWPSRVSTASNRLSFQAIVTRNAFCLHVERNVKAQTPKEKAS